jgi:hypothetical protein
MDSQIVHFSLVIHGGTDQNVLARTMRRCSLCLAMLVLVMDFGISQTSAGPSLQQTFEWMANTLKPSERNTTFTHRPNPRPYVRDWVDKEIDPYHMERITKFSHDGCRVTFNVEMIDNDMGLLLGKTFFYNAVDTFDLTDIDPGSIRIQDSCAPVETPSGPTEPWNCTDMQGKVVVFKTADARPRIHESGTASSMKSNYGNWGVRHGTKYNLDKMCKEVSTSGDSGNGAYCDQSDTKETPKDLTSATLGFSTPEYATRFATALRHAAELCGAKVHHSELGFT